MTAGDPAAGTAGTDTSGPAPTDHAQLEAHGITKSFGAVRALDGVDLAVAHGETVALVGASGSGKTTLLRMFNRLEEPTTGEISIAGRPASSLDPIELRRHTGYVQQEGGLLPHWTVARNVALVTELLGWAARRREERVCELLDLVGLPASDYRNRYPSELSGGQRQRVAVARALAADPPVILLDEPFGALDALTRRELQDAFRRLEEQIRKTMLLVTHDLEEAFLLADRVAVLRGGRLLQIDTPETLASAPADPYVAELLGGRSGDPGRDTPPRGAS
ncbi:MAG: ATP-binding cassette domain-containing protein [Candidatus Eiseniibacteriota bacterium]|jgi:osmoprotectant transport system ATP-binding protein